MSFVANDLIYSYGIDHEASGAAIIKHEIKAKVIGYTTKGVPLVNILSGSGYIDGDTVSGMKFVKVGNTANTSRQNGIYFDSISSNAPRIVMYTGMDRFSKLFDSALVKFQAGNLGNINDSSFGGYLTDDNTSSGNPEYGVYTDNFFGKGKIIAKSGELQTLSITNVLTVATDGAIKIGNGEKDIDLTGIYIDANEIVGQNNGNDKTVISAADGKLSVTDGTITGGIIQTSSSGDRIEITDSNVINFYVLNTKTSKDQIIYSIYPTFEAANGDTYSTFVIEDDTNTFYKIENKNDAAFTHYFYDYVRVEKSLYVGGNAIIDQTGNIRTFGTFQSSDNSSGISDSLTVITSLNDSDSDGNADQYKTKTITIKDGIITNIGSETNWQIIPTVQE